MPNNEALWPAGTSLWRPRGRWPVRSLIVLLGLVSCLPAGAATPRSTAWKTGADFERQLDALIDEVNWASNPLRPAVGRLARSQGVAILLDRRVDPDQEVQFAVHDTALRQLLREFAGHLSLGVCRVGPVVYLGPKSTAAVLGTVTALRQDEAQRMPATARSRLVRVKPLTWPELAEPRTLLTEVAADAGLRVTGIEQIPHDLWPAEQLPPLDVSQRLSLLLAGFGLTFEFAPDGRSIRLLPLPETAVLQRSYEPSSQQHAALQEIGRRFPETGIQRQGGSVLVTGPIEVHDAFRELVQGRRPATPPDAKTPAKGEVRWTLRIENKPVGAVVQTVAKRLDRQLEYDPALRSKLEQLVSFDVQNATLEQLMKTALTPIGLTYRLEGSSLRILAAASSP